MAIPATFSNYARYLAIIYQLERLLKQIKEDTKYSSKTSDIYEHPAFIELVNHYGEVIIPWLMEHSLQTGFSWVEISLFLALNLDCKIPVEHRGSFVDTISDILNWFTKSKFAKTDIYKGLLSD